jgi:hypothetical protein
MSTLITNILQSGAIQHTNGTVAITIDSSGRLLRPQSPAFHAFNGALSGGAESVIQFTTVGVNNGSNYNTGTYRFTAPVAGNYFFAFGGMTNATPTANRFGLHKNGVLYDNQKYAVSQAYERFSACWIVPMEVNDFVTIVSGITGAGENSVHQDYREFSGFLIG